MTSHKEPQVLEVVSAIARIASLSFYPEGTKIGIRDHHTVLCHKDESYRGKFKQGFDRLINGDSRNDLYMLNHVIIKYLKWYVIPYKTKDMETHNNLVNLIKYAIIGLKRLQSTYENGQLCNAILVIQYYINILKAIVVDKFDTNAFYNSEPFYVGDKDATESILDEDKLRKFWTKDELNTLCGQFNKCFIVDTETVSDDNDSCIDVSITGSLMDSDNHIFTGGLPTPIDTNDPTVQGMIVSIDEILKCKDDRFSNMLTCSIQGSVL